MWFHGSMDAPYGEGIEPALLDCGLKAHRVDREHPTQKIDDHIMAEIRRSRFVVVDLTCPIITQEGQAPFLNARGGVYFEAGFALGLGKPVIWCARKEMVDLLHFDIRQYPFLLWANPAELRTMLRDRVMAYGLAVARAGA